LGIKNDSLCGISTFCEFIIFKWSKREEFLSKDLGLVKDVLLTAALEGGKILKEHFRSEKVRAKTKSNHADLVTNVDLKTQEAVIQILSRDLPGMQIIGEEKENEEASGEVIYVDPLDGTLNFFHGQRQFAVSLGYWVDRMPAAGVVFNPVDEDLFVAVSGQGAFRNGRSIRPSPYRRLSQSVLATGWPYDKKELPRVLRSLGRLLPVTQEVRVWGTAALAMCYLAAGALEGYWERGLFPWDIAAGVVIAREAGCRITSIEGGPFELASGEVLATNGHVHEEMLECLREEPENAELGFGNGKRSRKERRERWKKG
jgi:myo-inositol-1(or 4)-monophosphatase